MHRCFLVTVQQSLSREDAEQIRFLLISQIRCADGKAGKTTDDLCSCIESIIAQIAAPGDPEAHKVQIKKQ